MCIILCAIFIPTQAQHLKFMGIPLTGTITQFQQKLATKGVVQDKTASARADYGTRIFKGPFAGSDATIVVWYDTNTKIVHGAKAYFTFYSPQSRDTKYNKLKSLLEEKYADEITNTDQVDDHESFNIEVTDETGVTVLGFISLYCMKSELSYRDYTVHVEYQDYKNKLKNKNNLMDDL